MPDEAITYDSRSELIDTLRTDGPQPLENHPNQCTRRLTPNLRRVVLSAGRHSGLNLGPVTAVWYLKGEHDPVDVVRAVIDANPRVVDPDHEAGAITEKFGNHSPELKRAWQDIQDEFDLKRSASGHTGGGSLDMETCPLGCGEEIADIPGHIRDCPNAQ